MQKFSRRRLLVGGLAAMVGPSSLASSIAPAEQVFGTPLSEAALAWLNDAVERYNATMDSLRRDWLDGTTGARTDLRRRRVIFESPKGELMFDAKVMGSSQPRGAQWLWVWGWSNPALPVNFRTPSARLQEVGNALALPALTTEKFYSDSEDLLLYLAAAALKVNGGVGVHRVRLSIGEVQGDTWYLLSNPQRA